MPYLIENLEIADNPIVLFRGIVGSRAYGTQNANSDTDVRGIFVVPTLESPSTRTKYVAAGRLTRSSFRSSVTAPCGWLRPMGRCACAEGVGLGERVARTAKQPQGPAQPSRA